MTDESERDELFNAITKVEGIRRKAQWAMRWIEDYSQPFAVRLVAFAAVEGIFFSSSFAAIFWLKSRGIMPGQCHMNELISRDEGLHTNFACVLHSQLDVKADAKTVARVIHEAVEIEQSFFYGNGPV